ncbi:Transcription factor SRM1 [Phytophthora citrophthora]|uniref:Transcription factor SRM1 n=1 Tax=Phytophthora citrophthora TaxID=4793 RepID=A0AAD9GQI9_9STRA|nr:Transcription factor SRM1 [Phytophthora citrophthora]
MGKKRSGSSLNISMVESNQHNSPWASDEHQRFLLALEQFGGGQCSSIGEAWQSITTAVGTRSPGQVVYHARLYFAQLQHLNAQKRQERQFMQSVDQRWTPEEDTSFENMLAAFSTSSVCYPWEVMASRLPGKSPVDLKERYQKLCYDVARIENGQHVTMLLGQFPRSSGLPLSTKAAAIGECGRLASQMTSPRVLDSVITLTPVEEQLLVDAMAEVFVPPEAPADLLAGIASAVAAFTSSNGRLPPQRTHPLFTKEQALEVLNGLLAAQQTDPQIVLETLAVQLRLHPRALNVSAGVSFSNSTTESSEPNLHLLATTGLTFGPMLPSPLAAELGMSFESTGTTPRFLGNLGLLSPSPRQSQAKNNGNNARVNPLPPLTPSERENSKE